MFTIEGAEVLVAKSVAPLYAAVTESFPSCSFVVFRVATPETSADVPRTSGVPLFVEVNVTVPVGVPYADVKMSR
jgi:hypothetical protein